MCNLANYRTPHRTITERQGNRQYIVSFPGSDDVFHLDSQPQPWQGGPIPDGIVIGQDTTGRICVVFVEIKSVGAHQPNFLNLVERVQIEKALRQILSGLYHFCPLCDCYNVSGGNCQDHPGQDHHRNWNTVFSGQNLPNFRGHQIAGTVLLLHFGVTVPPPSAARDRFSAQLGGSHLCPRKEVRRIKIMRRTVMSGGNISVAFQDLLP